MKLDGKEVKIGDRLWSFSYGWGTVHEIRAVLHYPVTLFFDTQLIHFTLEGKVISDTLGRDLFWDEIVFEIPKPPKKKVKKYLLLLQQSRFPKHFRITSEYYIEIEDYFTETNATWKALRIIPETEIEVDADD